MKTLIAAVVALSLSATRAQAATSSVPTHKASAVRPLSAALVLNKLHALDQQQIEGGNLAIQQAWSPQAREFGSRMVQDCTATEAKVAALAKKLNVTLTDPMDANLPAADQRDLREDTMQLHALSQFQGLDFDRSYLSVMAAGHQKAVRLLQMVATSAADAAVRDLATELLPLALEHRTLAETDLQAVAAPK
jgi:predicted outer membrane protein